MNEKVLLVDDETLLSMNTEAVLAEAGYRVDSVRSAEECLRRLEAGERPDLILMDLDFGPNRLDGSEATAKINTFYDIPVVLYSAYTDKETLEKTKTMTRYGYIQKVPGNEELITATMEMALKLHRMEHSERTSKEQLRREVELKEKITETAPVGIVVLDAEGEIIFANREAKRLFALEGEGGPEAGGPRRWKLTDLEGCPLPGPALPFEQVRSSGEPVYAAHRAVHRPDGSLTYLSINAEPLSEEGRFSGMVAAISDVTAAQRQQRRMEKINRVLRVLSEANQFFMRTSGERELLDQVCRVLTETGGYPFVWAGYARQDGEKRVEPAAAAGAAQEDLSAARISWGEGPHGGGPAGRAVRGGRSVVVNDLLDDPSCAPWREPLRRHGLTAAISLPLEVGNRVIGVLNIYCGGGEEVQEDELKLLRQLAADLSFGIRTLRSREERERAEEALHESELKYRTMFNNSNDAIYLHSVTEEGRPGTFVEVNDVACRMLGYGRQELLQLSPADIDTPESARRVPEIMEELQRRGSMTFEATHRSKDGRDIPVEISTSLFCLGGRQMVLSSVRDVTELRRVEKELREGQRRYRELSNHLQHVREEQLARLSREIHDDLGQSLTALKMNLTVLERSVKAEYGVEEDSPAARTVEEMKSILTGTVSKTRELVRELRPTVLDSSGLVEALEWQAEEFRRRFGMEVRMQREIEEAELDDQKSLAVFRIIQEALTNIARHSEASRARLYICREEEMLRIDVVDDGCGFDTKDKESSFGVMGMNERAEFCGGSLAISSEQGRGTRIVLRIPLGAQQ